MADKKVKKNIDLTKAVVAEYEASGSIDQTAKKLQMTKVKVQRILITKGLWSSKSSRQVAEMREQGFTVAEIANKLNKDVKTIQTYLPYSRGQYGITESYAAEKEREYRERKSNAAKGMIRKEDMTEGREFIDPDEAFLNGVNRKEIKNTKPYTDGELKENSFLTDASVYRLKLELVSDHYFSDVDGLGMGGEELDEFLRLAKAKKGISREVLVPGSMNLHSMHYMIQRLFGWQNSHLHHFELKPDEFETLTCKKVGLWTAMCGSLFHYSFDKSPDLYWDDDYDESQSVKNWLRKKYVGPYVQKAICTTYIATMDSVKLFYETFTGIEPGMSFEALFQKCQDFL